MSLGLLGQAARLGHCWHLELECFSLLGKRSVACRSHELARFCHEAAGSHAYRGALFAEQLPVSVGLPSPDALCIPTSSELTTALQGALNGPEEGLVSGIASILYPSILEGFGAHEGACSAVSDGAILRALRRAQADLEQRLLEARALAVGIVHDATWNELADEIASAGGIFGSI